MLVSYPHRAILQLPHGRWAFRCRCARLHTPLPMRLIFCHSFNASTIGGERRTTMTGLMPTRNGDIVISHRESSASVFLIWPVAETAQQIASPLLYTSPAIGRARAMKFATSLARRSRGRIFFVDTDSKVWTKLADYETVERATVRAGSALFVPGS